MVRTHKSVRERRPKKEPERVLRARNHARLLQECLSAKASSARSILAHRETPIASGAAQKLELEMAERRGLRGGKVEVGMGVGEAGAIRSAHGTKRLRYLAPAQAWCKPVAEILPSQHARQVNIALGGQSD